MKTALAAMGFLLLVATFAETTATAVAADLRVIHRHVFWRVWPRDCFLMPDVIVALDALGPVLFIAARPLSSDGATLVGAPPPVHSDR